VRGPEIARIEDRADGGILRDGGKGAVERENGLQ